MTYADMADSQPPLTRMWRPGTAIVQICKMVRQTGFGTQFTCWNRGCYGNKFSGLLL